jgi:sulfopyruvate decarboxylase alpha subunit
MLCSVRVATATSTIPDWALAVSRGIVAAGSRDVIYVPDNPLSHVLRALSAELEVRTTIATREEEAFGIAAGIYLGGGRPTVMLQSSGLGNSLNALTSLLVPYQIPVLIVISVRGEVGEWNAAQTPMGRALPTILRSIDVQAVSADRADAVGEAMALAAAVAFGTRMPAACLLPRRVTVPGRPA